ncbi:hypothetical protein JCM18899A_16070 [Nocardioides sp. AN3]
MERIDRSGNATPFWLTIFVDLPAPVHESGTRFGQGVTGYRLSSTRGDTGTVRGWTS